MNRNTFRTHASTLRARTRNTLRRRTAPLIVRYRNGFTVTRALATGELTTITRYLDRHNADPNFQRSNSSQIGKAVARAYRANNDGRDPLRVWTVSRTHGLPIHVFAYSRHNAALAEGLHAFLTRPASKPVAHGRDLTAV